MEQGGNEARLERIQGGVDLINERLAHANRINDERHETLKGDLIKLGERVHTHGNHLQPLIGLPARVDALEDERHQRAGEKRGISNTIKTAWMLGGSGVTAVLLAVLRKLGLM